MTEHLVPIFVYGTLRPGDYNHGRFPGGVAKVDSGCKTNGRLYHAFDDSPPRRIYPGVRFDEEGTVHGDILWYERTSSALRSVTSMELGAGYDVVEIKVQTATGEVVEALGFQYERPHGKRIESGDWFAPDAFPGTDLTDFAEDEYGEDWGDEDWYDDGEDD